MKTFRLSLLLATGAAALGAGSLLLLGADQAAAKSTPPPATELQPGDGPRHPKAGKRLALTEEQKTRLQAVRAKTREAVKAIRDDASLDPQQKREKARAAVKAARDEAQTVFTPEQKEKLARLREHVGARIRHGIKARIHERMAGWHGRQAGPGWGQGMPHHPGMGPHGPGMMPDRRPPGPPMGFGFGPQERGWQGKRGVGPMGPGPQMGPGWQPGGQGGFAGGPGFGAHLQLTDEQKAKAAELQKKQREKLSELMAAGRAEFRSLLTPEQQKEFDARAPQGPAQK